MNQVPVKDRYLIIILIPFLLILSACSEWIVPADLPGTYSGRQRVIIRYDKGGQYIFKDSNAMVSLIISRNGEVIGMIGEATLEDCTVVQNRGWIGRQLGIKTDFLIKGMLKGNTFDSDTIMNKNISIPFNIENGELTGSLFMTTKADSYPIISSLKLQKK